MIDYEYVNVRRLRTAGEEGKDGKGVGRICKGLERNGMDGKGL